ncbi:gamma-tubulin complex component 5 [Octodon degus]|uniref:Gamma-tubulin complex component n=1 Tax=Octodon degus TaxID=10160 RepID=A0A6P6DKE2_OCTDE|nr:gamma-tubulin complex component 5 [Octodon degus]
MAWAGRPAGRAESQREQDLRALIRQVTGLQDEADPNFQLALNFAWSNFRFHRFLDVDSHKIEKTIEGIYEKFIIHSDLSKAASWKRLTEEFLNASLPSIEEIKTDAHYSILSLLLCLSDSPSNSNYVETPRAKEVEKQDDFDWGKYLMEGEEIDLGANIDTPNWSEDSDDEGPRQPLSREDSGIQVDRTPLEEHDAHRRLGLRTRWKADEPSSRSWLEQRVVRLYWTSRAARSPHSLHLHSNLAAVWDQHLYSSDPLYVPEDRVVVTETQVIRETLWLLSGVKKLFMFQLVDGKVTVRNNIVVTHLTQSCLRSALEQIAAYGQVVFRLQEFIDEVMGHSSESLFPGNSPAPKKSAEAPFRTYQAFMWALYKYFMSFKEELTAIEKCIISNDTTVTLAIVVDKLAPRLAQLNVLNKVFSTGVAEVPPDTRNVVRASHLLNTLYKAILEYDSVGEASEQTDREDVQGPTLSFSQHQHCPQGPGQRRVLRTEQCPQPPLSLWLAGCGVVLEFADAERKSLYTLFLESVQSRLRCGEDSAPQVLAEQQATQGSLGKMQSIAAEHLELDGVHDPLLAINFARLYLEQSDFHEKFAGGDICMDRSSESVTCQTFELTLRSCLYPHIEKQYLDCCGNLMQTLKRDYRLVEYLQAMRNFFLMEGGDTMYDFYTSIFDKIREKEPWQNVSFLNVQLQEAVGQRYPEDSSRLSISFENVDTAKKKLPVHVLDGLTLSYKVPWPVDIVISLECQKIYNQVFLLLLQIKWAKYSLDVLLFGDLADTAERAQPKRGLTCEQDAAALFGVQTAPVRQQIHRMFLLRVKLMHFVNSLHNYIMTRILHSTGLEFQHQVEEAKDLDQLIKIHYRYLSTIHDRCLLREKVSFVKEAIMKVLNLALLFAEGWQAGLGTWQMGSIEQMESDFKNCHMFLVTILNKAVCRGSFPHLESLALSLMAGMEQN